MGRLREELHKFVIWLSKNSDRFFPMRYTSTSVEYVDKINGVVETQNPGTATSRLVG